MTFVWKYFGQDTIYVRKYFFTNRVANNWNSLPSHVVHADTVNSFKSRLDNFWKSPDVLYDYAC